MAAADQTANQIIAEAGRAAEHRGNEIVAEARDKANDIRRRDYLECAEDLLILHGTADEIVPFEESQAFADDNLIEFIPVQGADHRFQNPAHMSLANKSAMAFFGLR